MVARVTEPAPPLVTADELLAMAPALGRFELSQGALVPMSPAAFNSGLYARRIAGPLGEFVDDRELGLCGVAESGFVLSRTPDTVREPDVWFVTQERAPTREQGEQFFEGAPVLAVEVITPTDQFRDVIAKAREYLAAGTRLLWLLDPGPRLTLVLRGDGRYTWLDETGTFDGEDVVPGFTLALGRVFR